MSPDLVRVLLGIAVAFAGWMAITLLNVQREVVKLRVVLTGEDGKNGVKGDLGKLEAEVRELPVLKERVDGICERVDQNTEKTIEVSKRVHQHDSWLTVIGHKLNIEFRR